jgi:hypothetical protein
MALAPVDSQLSSAFANEAAFAGVGDSDSRVRSCQALVKDAETCEWLRANVAVYLPAERCRLPVVAHSLYSHLTPCFAVGHRGHGPAPYSSHPFGRAS